MTERCSLTSVKLIRNLKELQSYSKDWNNFLERSQNNNIFLTWEWLSNWIKVYLRQNNLLTLIVFEDEELVAIVPLWVEKVRFWGVLQLKVLKFLGSGEVCADHLDLIMGVKNVSDRARAIWDYLYGPLRSEWDIFEYYNVPNNSPVLDAFYKLGDEDDRCIKREIVDFSICPYISLPDSWDTYEASLSRNQRKGLRKSTKLLIEMGELELKFCRNVESLQNEMQRLIKLNRRSWRQRGRSGSFATDEFKHFHEILSRELLAKKMLFLCSLWLDGHHIGSSYAFEYNRTVYGYIIAVEKSPIKRASVGRVLLGLCIKETIERGCREYDQLRGDEEYKYEWSSLARRNLSLRFYNRNVNTFAFILYRFTYDYLKQIVKTLLGARVIFLKKLFRKR